MKRIGDLLGKFTKIAQDSGDARVAIINALKDAGVKIDDEKKITIRNGIVTLKISPVQKSEVALRQKKILEALQKNPLTKKITVVR